MTAGEMVLRAVLALLAAYHLAMGLASIFFQRWAAGLARGLYALEMEDSGARFSYALRMLGLYALAYAYWLARAAMDPAGHRTVIWTAVALQGARGISRLMSAETLRGSFGVPAVRNRFSAAMLFLQAGLLAWLTR